MGHGSEGDIKYARNGEDPGSNVQGGGTLGAIIWQQELGSDRGDAQGTGGVPPSGGATDHGYDGETRGRLRVGAPIDSGGDGNRWASPHWIVHQEAKEDHSGEGVLPPHLCTVHGGGADAGDEPVGAMVGSRRGKRTQGVDEEEV